jgi:hypothetical protein
LTIEGTGAGSLIRIHTSAGGSGSGFGSGSGTLFFYYIKKFLLKIRYTEATKDKTLIKKQQQM